MSLFDIDNVQTTPIKSTDWKWSFSDYPQEKNGLTVFSCFACGGGSTMGYKLAGCDVIGDLEIDPKMNEVYVKNHKPKYNYCMDIREFNELDNLPKELYSLDILDGSPPCSPFAMSGDREDSWGKRKKFREGQSEQVLDDLPFVFIETVKKLNPKTVIMENVEGITAGTAYKYVLKIYQKFSEIGYRVKHWLVRGECMGVPQKRHRVIFFAVRDDVKFDLETISMNFNYLPVVYDEIRSGERRGVSDKMMQILNEAKPDEYDCVGAWNRIYNNGGTKRMYFNHILIHDDDVFPTVSGGHNCLFDYKHKSAVSAMDIIHAQTFPEDFDFVSNNFGNINYICGMSVPPLMMKRVVDRLIESGVYNYAKNRENEQS